MPFRRLGLLAYAIIAPVIRAENLVKRFGKRAAVDGLSFEVPAGQVCGLLGPNGAGKTTTLRLLAGYLPPDAGTASLAGLDVEQKPREARARLGYLPENNPLDPELDAVETLELAAGLRGMPPARAEERIAWAVKACALGEELGKPVGELSKGYRQRLGLAQALLHDPDVLILDEPTSGLDPNQSREVRALISTLRAGKSVLLSTHSLADAESLCDRVLVLARGGLRADAAPRALADSAGGGSLEEAFRRLTL